MALKAFSIGIYVDMCHIRQKVNISDDNKNDTVHTLLEQRYNDLSFTGSCGSSI